MALKIKKQINDNVHGYIGLTEIELRLIDTPIFQRLRYIKQLGPAYLVYPGATHTRFAHSLGTLFMMDLFIRNSIRQEVSDDDAQRLRLAGLLHDIGHYPFSHTLEQVVVDKFGGKNHEEFGAEIIRKFLSDRLENYGTEEITRTISGKAKKEFGMLLSSSLDADKSDYMLRDSYNTGVPYGRVDITSLLRLMTFQKGMVIFEKDESPVENFLLDRYHLYKTVVNHKTTAGFNVLIQRTFEFLTGEGYLPDPRTLLKDDQSILGYTDDSVMQSMHSYLRAGREGIRKELIKMYTERMPLELAYLSASLVKGKDISPDRRAIGEMAGDPDAREKLAESVGLDPEWIFPTSLRSLSFIEEGAEIYIRKRDGLVPLAEGNAFILNMLMGKTLYDSRIYAKRGYGRKVSEAFAKAGR